MTSSSSSDDENLEMLQEAVDLRFINDSMYKNGEITNKPAKSKEVEIPKSLRRRDDEDEQFNGLKVTPEFQNFVAQRLSSFLEQKLSKQLTDTKKIKKLHRNNEFSGVKLFRASKNYVDVQNDECTTAKIKRKKIKVRECERDNVDESTKVQEAAVTAEDVLSKKEVKHWSVRSKAPVFNYRKESGKLVYVEPDFK